ncbi:MAG: T9SS type A sorting domain-containing protein [Bacteroidetes bacterium]|nr:T9SS type A sorting domain-containing protein [Bacteroidota bacterium]
MKKLLLLICSLAMAAALQAQVIHVPGDYPTIQQGINAANFGDTVLVSDGTYYEQINFLGKKPLTVASEFLMDGDTSHISNTIIDGSQLTNTDSSSVVYFVSGEDTTSILCGFTITQGMGTQYIAAGSDFRAGGGVFISNSGAMIIHNHITENHLTYTIPGSAQIVAGAGLSCEFNMADHWIIIDHNLIDYNSCYSGSVESDGAGLVVCYNARITNNTISNNTCTGAANSIAAGAAFLCARDPVWTNLVTAIVQHNIIINNLCESENNWAISAGGVFQAVKVLFSDNEVAYNTLISGSPEGGSAGIGVFTPDPGSVISNNVFKGNVSNSLSGALYLQNDVALDNPVMVENNYFLENESIIGAAFETAGVQVTLQNNVFSGNHAENEGGAIYLYKYNTSVDHLAILINNTFSFNSAANYGGAICSFDADPLIFNCIFWQDSAAGGQEISINSESAEIGFSNIDPDGIDGEYVDDGGNMFEPPQFSDDILLTLDPSSPCIESGTERILSNGTYVYAPEYDILGQPRPLDNEWDMGAYETLLVGQHEIITPTSRFFHVVYPNPASDQTKLIYDLLEGSDVSITIYDLTGHLIRHHSEGYQTKGMHETVLNLEDVPSGVYFYRLSSTVNRQPSTGKMVVVK